ncbi:MULTISPECIES: MATE family efflux transporter [Mycobacteroides]|uniref:MATE family efflux transporter n=1 Tax=Mycobacteroides chelonae TaxID=1774 RepID=A0AB73MZ58_MYCCH|nr:MULTISPECIES: MATE family efflux transporter [Mycobacteroides]KRQ24780.1 MATE family efflux transporter [Mycobacteroides sp. H072]KRQ37670.1 MATE family efflux transporter [Mycobacteroides sp. H002]KRQ47173.1 MATE family efflux transporter [Mycobacteroides sp. H054]KRQ69185.1 MATE family efflux transporter [Mycobacteroides sp. H001]MBF9326415.1 MATE family efflux transporter [Mycobacteroides chelonae]
MTDATGTTGLSGLARRIIALAVPALGVLAAEPLYLLFDIAMVGRLGAVPLAGLAVGGLVLSLVGTQLTFLSYGTTARAARRFGSGDRPGAVHEGVQATWLALIIGAAVVLVVNVVASPVVRVIAASPDVAAQGLTWVRIAIFAAPAILISLAGNGWMRGVQNTVRPLRYVIVGFAVSAVLCPVLIYGLLSAPRMGLAGSAIANLVGQWLAAILFLRALHAEQVRLRMDPPVLRAQLVLARDLLVRSLAFQACFISAAAVAARFGAAALAAHQVVLQMWSFLALVLDSLAIAAQTLVGAALGAGRVPQAKSVARRVTVFSLGFAVVLAALLALGAPVLPGLFTSDVAVLHQMRVPWWFLVCQLPISGVVFALDGVLLGAADARFMRNATMISALCGFLPLVWLSLAYGWGLAGIWSGLTLFLVLRLMLVGWRALSGRWAVPGSGS